MHKLLWVIFIIMYKVGAWKSRSNFEKDYDEPEINKRHSIDERRNWRKKALLKEDHTDLEDTRPRRHELHTGVMKTESHHYNIEDIDRKEREDILIDSDYKHFGDYEHNGQKSSEIYEKDEFNKRTKKSEDDKKIPMNCERIHERYESCFAGCAAVTCDNPRERMRPCYPFCEQGCVCVQPYVRDDRTHKCVTPENCTKGLKGIPDLNSEI